MGGLAAAGTPSGESQESFSEERSKNCASAALASFFFPVLFEGLFAATWYPLHHHPCPIQAVSGGYLPPFPHPPHCCGDIESGGKLTGQDRCLKALESVYSN